MNYKIIDKYLDEQCNCILKIKKNLANEIKLISETLISAKETGNKIYLIGNGGSSSTATHFSSDLLKTSITKNKTRFKAFSLSDNIPVLLAWANDTSYEDIFSSQLENLLEKNDILIAISGSGNSPNILKAVNYANSVNAITIAFTGIGGGKLAKLARIKLVIPSDDMLTIETMHLLICHLITTIFRSEDTPMFSY